MKKKKLMRSNRKKHSIRLSIFATSNNLLKPSTRKAISRHNLMSNTTKIISRDNVMPSTRNAISRNYLIPSKKTIIEESSKLIPLPVPELETPNDAIQNLRSKKIKLEQALNFFLRE